VIKGTYQGKYVAIKKIKEKLTEKQITDFLKEVELTKNIPPHPNVIRCIGVSLHPLSLGKALVIMKSEWYLVLDFCEGGSLYEKLNNSEFNVNQKLKLIEDICKGMVHLRK
jgi:serine/threonine protein kinase